MHSRRAVLATAGLLTLAGCLPEEGAAHRPDPDLRLRRRVAREVRALATSYAAVTRAHPGTAARLGPLAAEHEAHVTALEGPAVTSPAASPSPAATPSPAPSVPATADAAVAWLVRLELAAAARRVRQCRDAGPDLARLLASVGACEAGHAALLRRGA